MVSICLALLTTVEEESLSAETCRRQRSVPFVHAAISVEVCARHVREWLAETSGSPKNAAPGARASPNRLRQSSEAPEANGLYSHPERCGRATASNAPPATPDARRGNHR